MTITAYPKPSQTITTDQFRDFFRELLATGALNDAALKPYGDSSGLVVKFDPGFAAIDGIAVKSTAVESIAVGAGSGGGLSRIDTLVANLDFSAAPIVQFEVLAGIPASTGAVPPSLALTGSIVYRWPIADIAVSPTASTITAANVTDRRTFTSKGVGLWTTATRPSSPRNGQLGFNLTTGRWEWRDGAGWSDLMPSVAWSDITGKPSTFPPSAHHHNWSDIDNAPSTYAPSAHDINGTAHTGTLSIANGGTGATTADTARNALKVLVQSTAMSAGTALNTIRFW